MVNQLSLYCYNGSNLDYGLLNNEPVFNLNYVANLLELSNPRTSIDTSDSDYVVKLDDSVVSFTYNRNLNNRGELFLTESGLYYLLMHSNKPIAKPFQKWIAKDVIPSIRKTGSYSTTSNTAVDWVGIQAVLATCYSGNQLTLAMDNVYKNTHNNTSALELSNTQLVNPVQERYYSPTEIGEMVEPKISAQKVNQALYKIGLQVHNEHGDWMPTAEGAKHSVIVDTGKKHNSGASIPQLKWYADDFILNQVQGFATAMEKLVKPLWQKKLAKRGE